MKVVQNDRLYQPAIGMNQNCTGEYGGKDMLDVAVTIAGFNIIQSQNVKQAKWIQPERPWKLRSPYQ